VPNWQSLLKEGRAIRNAEVVAERPDGTRVSVHPISDTASRWRWQDSRGDQYAGPNVSERKQAETQHAILSTN